MLKHISFIFIFLILSNLGFSQKDTVYRLGIIQEVVVKDRSYQNKYQNTLRRVKRVYPYVLEAQKLFSEFQVKTASMTKKSQVKKFGRQQNRLLRKDFVYAMKELYRRDGVVMMKMIHSKTNRTTYDIIRKYRGKAHADWIYGIGKMFDQDFKVKYNKKDDYILGHIMRDIESGKVKVPTELVKLSKSEFKAKRKKERKDRKARKKKRRQKKKEKKKAERKAKKNKTEGK